MIIFKPSEKLKNDIEILIGPAAFEYWWKQAECYKKWFL